LPIGTQVVLTRLRLTMTARKIAGTPMPDA
jgi:hypothetical protein